MRAARRGPGGPGEGEGGALPAAAALGGALFCGPWRRAGARQLPGSLPLACSPAPRTSGGRESLAAPGTSCADRPRLPAARWRPLGSSASGQGLSPPNRRPAVAFLAWLYGVSRSVGGGGGCCQCGARGVGTAPLPPPLLPVDLAPAALQSSSQGRPCKASFSSSAPVGEART